jgi:hypothetical protein
LGPELALHADGSNGAINLDAKLGIGEIDIDRFPANN